MICFPGAYMGLSLGVYIKLDYFISSWICSKHIVGEAGKRSMEKPHQMNCVAESKHQHKRRHGDDKDGHLVQRAERNLPG